MFWRGHVDVVHRGLAARDIPLLERAVILEGAGAQFYTALPLPEGPFDVRQR